VILSGNGGRSKNSALFFIVTFIFVGWSYKFVPRLCVTACYISLTNALILIDQCSDMVSCKARDVHRGSMGLNVA
jgi:hypothetical protein